MRSKTSMAVGAACMWVSGAAIAGQTVTYTYDALGRLSQSQVQSGPETGATRTFSYDGAGNRTQYSVTGATGQTPLALTMGNTVVTETSAGATITVDLGASSASGTLTLTENGVFLGSTWVANGQASLILEGYPPGSHTITATYSGDGTYATQITTFTIKVTNVGWLPGVLNLLLN